MNSKRIKSFLSSVSDEIESFDRQKIGSQKTNDSFAKSDVSFFRHVQVQFTVCRRRIGNFVQYFVNSNILLLFYCFSMCLICILVYLCLVSFIILLFYPVSVQILRNIKFALRKHSVNKVLRLKCNDKKVVQLLNFPFILHLFTNIRQLAFIFRKSVHNHVLYRSLLLLLNCFGGSEISIV